MFTFVGLNFGQNCLRIAHQRQMQELFIMHHANALLMVEK